MTTTTPGAGAGVPEALRALLDAADTDTLLRDAEGLAETITEAGWTPDVESGRFGIDGWDLLSSAWAPNVSVFFEGDEGEVRDRGRAVASLITARGGRWVYHPRADDWPAWTADDERWATTDWLAVEPLEWHGRGVVVSLYVRPLVQAAKVTAPANLHLAIERADTPPEGLPHDDDRARRVAREGSVVERWYLAGEHELPDDVIAALEDDPDSRVRAAAASERWYRERTFDGPPPTA